MCKVGNIVIYKDGPSNKIWQRAKVLPADCGYSLLNSAGNAITRNRSMVLPDETGEGFFVSHNQIVDALPSSVSEQSASTKDCENML